MLEKETARKPIFRAKHFCICRESDKELPGYNQITVHNPSTGQDQVKWIDAYNKMGGFINSIEWYKRKDEASGTTFKGLYLNVVDTEMDILLDLPFGKKPYRVFVSCARNMDFSKPVVFRAWKGKNEKTGKDEIAFVIEQNGETITWYYKKGQNGLPDAVHNARTDEWDFKAQEDFLLDDILEHVAPLIDAAAAKRGVKQIQTVSPDDDFGDESDGLPVTGSNGKWTVGDPPRTQTVWLAKTGIEQCSCLPERKDTSNPACPHIEAVTQKVKTDGARKAALTPLTNTNGKQLAAAAGADQQTAFIERKEVLPMEDEDDIPF